MMMAYGSLEIAVGKIRKIPGNPELNKKANLRSPSSHSAALHEHLQHKWRSEWMKLEPEPAWQAGNRLRNGARF
jgi:hypothetical protein